MESKQAGRSFLPIVIIFIVTTIILIAAPFPERLGNISRDVLTGGNIILFVATTVSFYFYRKSLGNNNPHAFVRMIYGGMFAKMFICIIAAAVYIMLSDKNVSKGAIFGCMFLYFVYTFVEISIILKLSRQGKYAKDRSSAGGH